MRFFLSIAVATLTLSGCSVIGGEGQKRNQLWEQYTAEGHAAEKADKLQDAEGKYRKAIELGSNFHASDARQCGTIVSLAEVLRKQGRDAEARKYYEQALSWYENWEKKSTPEETLNRAGKQMAVANLGLGRLLEAQGDLPGARDLYRRALQLGAHGSIGIRLYEEAQQAYILVLERMGDRVAADKEKRKTSAAIIAALSDAGHSPSPTGRPEVSRLSEAENNYKRFRTKYGATDERTMAAALDLIHYYRGDGRSKETIGMIREYLADPVSSNPRYKAMFLNQLSGVLRETHDFAGSVAAATESLAVSTPLNEQEEMAQSRFFIGMAQKDNPKTRKDAIANLKLAWDVQRGYNVDPVFWECSLALAKLYAADKRWHDAIEILKESAYAQSGEHKSSDMSLRTLEALSTAYKNDNQIAEAERCNQTIAAMRSSIAGR